MAQFATRRGLNMSNNTQYKKVYGARVFKINYNQDADVVDLVCQRSSQEKGYEEIHLRLELTGDCCSHSFYTDPKQFLELMGSTITHIEERENKTDETDDEVQRWKFLVFTTDRGHVTIDWRNDSNGYYDGEITATILKVDNDEPEQMV